MLSSSCDVFPVQVLLTEPPMNPTKNREKMIEVSSCYIIPYQLFRVATYVRTYMWCVVYFPSAFFLSGYV